MKPITIQYSEFELREIQNVQNMQEDDGYVYDFIIPEYQEDKCRIRIVYFFLSPLDFCILQLPSTLVS